MPNPSVLSVESIIGNNMKEYTSEEFNLVRTAIRIESGKYHAIARKSGIATDDGDNVASIYLRMARTLRSIADRMDEMADDKSEALKIKQV